MKSIFKKIHFLNVILSVISIGCVAFAASAERGLSHKRAPEKSYRSYVAEAKKKLRFSGRRERGGSGYGSALEAAQPLPAVNFSSVVAWESTELVQTVFQDLRDKRFLNDPSHENFTRRSSWLYPDDGCFARAELARINIENHTQNFVNKVFIFGDLNVTTNNSPSGSVSWWYHVAPIVRVQNDVWVFDPAIEPSRPLLFSEWAETMSESHADITVAICAGGAYTPSSDCLNPADASQKAYEEQTEYLEAEWERQLELGRDPEQVLGLFPPWLENGIRQLVEATGIEPATF